MLRSLMLLSVLLLNVACGAKTNPIAYTVSKDEKESFEALLKLAQGAYDKKDYENSEKYAEQAFALNPASEEAAVTLGYAYLARVNITPFGLARKLGDQGRSSSDSDEGKNSGDVLGGLKDVIALSQADFDKLGSVNRDVPELPVIVPVCAGQARQDIRQLGIVNKIVTTTCPFVDAKIRLEEDLRHTCTTNTQAHKHRVKAHFLWALAHLVEALIFHGVMTYTTTEDKSKTNLEQRVAAIQKIEIKDPTQIPQFISEVSSLQEVITKVLPVIADCPGLNPQTQLDAMVNDMLSVSLAFGQIPGVPPEITESITSSMAKIAKLRASTAQVKNAEAKTNAFKGDLTSKISKSISAKVNASKASDYTPAQVTQICTSYASISGNQADDKNKPEMCQGT